MEFLTIYLGLYFCSFSKQSIASKAFLEKVKIKKTIKTILQSNSINQTYTSFHCSAVNHIYNNSNWCFFSVNKNRQIITAFVFK
jgi:hypothetical protein